jgi:hypothetical protein
MSTNLTLDSLKLLSSQVGYNHMASCLNEISAIDKLNLQERIWKESFQFEHMTNWCDAGRSCRSTDFINCEKERSNSITYDMQRLNREMVHPPLWSFMICRMLFTMLRPMSIFTEILHTGISFICKGEKGCRCQLKWILCCLWSSWKKNLRKFTLESSLVLIFATSFSWRVDRKSFSCGCQLNFSLMMDHHIDVLLYASFLSIPIVSCYYWQTSLICCYSLLHLLSVSQSLFCC